MPRQLKYLSGPTKTVRIPISLAPLVMDYVQRLDQAAAGVKSTPPPTDAPIDHPKAQSSSKLRKKKRKGGKK